MSSVEEIQQAIEQLPEADRARLEQWIVSRDDAWDKQMKGDLAAGKFDALLEEIREGIRQDRLEDGP